MPIEIDERWEYWVGDEEVEEFLRDQNEEIVRAHKKTTQSPFHFLFGGDESMESGRFFDGIKFGTAKFLKPWFLWNTSNKGVETIQGMFEEQIRCISRANRYDFLARTFCRAWDNLPQESVGILDAMLAWVPPEKTDADCHKTGRPPGSPFDSATELLGRNRYFVRREYLKIKHAFLMEAIPDELRPKCGCGCGGIVGIGTQTNSIFDHRAGKPVTFIAGHNAIKKRNDMIRRGIEEAEQDQLKVAAKAEEDRRRSAELVEMEAQAAILVPESTRLPIDNGLESAAPGFPDRQMGGRCKFCNLRHVGLCNKVRSIEYFDDGRIKRVEFHAG